MEKLNDRVEKELEDRFEAAEFEEQSVTVVVPDRTRPVDYRRHVGPLLRRLDRADADARVLAGIGLHRPMTSDESAPLREVCERFEIPFHQHDAESSHLAEVEADVSEGRPGWPALPASFHSAVVEADAVIVVGTVEPHQYAGYSGGAKGIAIGCGSRATIGAMHGLEFLRDDGTRLGGVEDNPFHAATWRLVETLPPIFGLQVVPSAGDAAERYAFGPIDRAFGRARRLARTRFFQMLETPQDWLHLPVPPEKGTNFYQASRAATYVALVDRPALADGATVVVEAPCPEGVGQGTGELNCARAIQRGPDQLLEELRSGTPIETSGGEQRAYVIAKTLARCDVILVGAPDMEVLDAAGIPQYEDFESAIRDRRFTGVGRTIEDVFHAVPTLAPPETED